MYFELKLWIVMCRGGEEEKFGGSLFQQQKKLENWEDQILNLNPSSAAFPRIRNNNHVVGDDVKQEVGQSGSCQVYDDEDELIHPNKASNTWPHHHHHQQQMMPVCSSSPINSCITTLSNNLLNFSTPPQPCKINQDHSSEVSHF